MSPTSDAASASATLPPLAVVVKTAQITTQRSSSSHSTPSEDVGGSGGDAKARRNLKASSTNHDDVNNHRRGGQLGQSNESHENNDPSDGSSSADVSSSSGSSSSSTSSSASSPSVSGSSASSDSGSGSDNATNRGDDSVGRSFAIDVSQAFQVAHSCGITPLFLHVRHADDATPIILIPHPHTKRVTLHDGEAYELGAFIGRDLVRLSPTAAAAMRRAKLQLPGGSGLHSEMSFRLYRALFAFQRRVRQAAQEANGDSTQCHGVLDVGIAAGLRIGATLQQHLHSITGMGMQAVQSLAAMMGSTTSASLPSEELTPRPTQQQSPPTVITMVDHPWLRPLQQALLDKEEDEGYALGSSSSDDDEGEEDEEEG